MRHKPLASFEDLAAPKFLSDATGTKIRDVRCRPFVGGSSASGSRFLAVETNSGRGPRFVVKLNSPTIDWIVRGTDDHRGWEVLAWSTGLLDRLPPDISHPVVACAWDGDGWAILMRDVSDLMLPDSEGETPLSVADHQLILDGSAALHAAFWDQPHVADPALGFCHPSRRYTVFTPATGEREAEHPNPAIREIREGWPLLWPMLAPDIAALLRRLLDDPAPLGAAQARSPQTVVHGDPRVANLEIRRGQTEQVVLLDWLFVGPGTPAIDLAWYLGDVAFRAPVDRDTTFAWYRDALARRLGSRFSTEWRRPQLELSLLGDLLRSGWAYAWHAHRNSSVVIREWMRDGLAWWSARAGEGARWL